MKNIVVILSLFGLLTSSLAAMRKPNILVILTDDLGYGETSCQGCKDIPTPNIDAMAKHGIRIPLIIQWKGHLPAGKVDDRPVISLDIHPTGYSLGRLTTTWAQAMREPSIC